jgi:hypothetical protein
MTFPDYWNSVVAKFPHLAEDARKTTIKISSLKALMEQSHQMGIATGKHIAAFNAMQNQSNSGADLFDTLFGRGKR